MKAYGVKRKDKGCCPGHDKYPSQPYKITDRRSFKRRIKAAKANERIKNKIKEVM